MRDALIKDYKKGLAPIAILSVVASAMAVLFIGGAFIGLAVAKKGDGSAESPSTYSDYAGAEFEEVRSFRVNLTRYSPNMDGNHCDKTGGGSSTADSTGKFRYYNDRIRWVKNDNSSIEDYVFAEPTSDHIIAWDERERYAVVIPGFNNNQPIHIRDHYKKGLHNNKNYLDLFVPCDEMDSTEKELVSLPHAKNGTYDAVIVDLTKPKVGSQKIDENKVCLDPGHGGSDDRGYLGDETEGGNNWTVTKKVEEMLIKNGYKVALTKDSKESNPKLEDRVKTINQSGCGLVVSIHSNATKSTKKGSGPLGIVYCRHKGIIDNNGHVEYMSDTACLGSPRLQQSITLSHNLTDQIKNDFSFKKSSYWGGDLGVLYGINVPGALIEMFHHDNQSDLNKYDNNAEKMAKSIATAIMKSLK